MTESRTIHNSMSELFSLSFSVYYQPTVIEAIEEYHKHTCLRFVERTNESNWLLFVYKSGYVYRNLCSIEAERKYLI